MSDGVHRVPALMGLGLVCLAAAALLAWFSSVTTMRLARTGTTSALTFETRLFNLFAIDRQMFEGVTGATIVRSRLPGVRSNTPDYLVFESSHGAVDAGYAQQHFWRDYTVIDAFFQNTESTELHLSSIARGDELRRFVFAQLAVLFLAGLGIGVWWLAVQTLVGRRRAVGL